MSEQTVNSHFDDFLTDFDDRQPSVQSSDSSQNQPQKNQQFLINDFDDNVGIDDFVQQQQPARPTVTSSTVNDFTGDHFIDENKYSSSKTTADLLGDFLDRERGDPSASPTFDVKAEINTAPVRPDVPPPMPPPRIAENQHFIDNLQNNETIEVSDANKNNVADDEDFGQIQPDYLNPYASTKLESNEKFISTDDLIGLSDNEGKDNVEFEDCKKEDESPLSAAVADTIKEPEPVVNVFTKPVESVKTEPEVVAKPESVVKPAAPEVAKRPQMPIPEPEPVKKQEQKKPESKKPVEPLEAEKLFKRIGLDSWFKPETLHPKVESLIYWRDIKKSGVVFGAGLAILLALSYCSLISVFAYVSLIALAGTVAFRIYKNILQAVQKTSEGHPFKDFLDYDITLSPERVQQVTTVAVSHANAALTELRRLFLVEDLVDSIKFGVLLYCLTYVGALFNGMTLLILGFIALFSLPKVYETNKTVIDAQLDVVRSKISEVTSKIKAAVPMGKKSESDKDK